MGPHFPGGNLGICQVQVLIRDNLTDFLTSRCIEYYHFIQTCNSTVGSSVGWVCKLRSWQERCGTTASSPSWARQVLFYSLNLLNLFCVALSSLVLIYDKWLSWIIECLCLAWSYMQWSAAKILQLLHKFSKIKVHLGSKQFMLHRGPCVTHDVKQTYTGKVQKSSPLLGIWLHKFEYFWSKIIILLDWARTGLPVKSLGFGEDGQAKAKPSCAEREARVKMKVNSVPYFKLAAYNGTNCTKHQHRILARLHQLCATYALK